MPSDEGKAVGTLPDKEESLTVVRKEENVAAKKVRKVTREESTKMHPRSARPVLADTQT